MTTLRLLITFGAVATLFAIVSAHEDFPLPPNTEKDTASAPMPPDEVVRTAKLPPGFKLSVFAAEPDVHNPIAITFDERGRLWVAESYSWAGNGDGGFRAEIRDRILIFEDTDNDGRHDRRTVFWDDARRLTSIEVGYGGVWAICLPNLLFIPDADRDARPDGAPIVKLDGFDGGSGSHTPANGLKWGPDGWLYARQGIQVTSLIGKPGSSESQRLKFNTGIWRYHPVRGTVEAVMHGMTNSWGFDFDKHGEMFCSNTVIGHLWHVVPGLHTERMYGADPNPYVFDLVKQTADHVHWDTGEVWNDVRKGVTDKTSAAGGGHAHIGLMIYQGDNWPAEYRDKAYTLNLHGRRINCDVLNRDGCTYTATHGEDICFIQDPWFRGMDLITGPDGGVFIADWSDTGECHDHDGVHRTSGRIYKLTYGEPRKLPAFNLAKASDEELIILHNESNQWWPRQARTELLRRFATLSYLPSTIEKLSEHLNSGGQFQLLETCCLLNLSDLKLKSQLKEGTEFERALAVIRFVSNSRHTPPVEPLADRVQFDSSGLVMLKVASSLQGMTDDRIRELSVSLSQRDDFPEDRLFPHLLWYGIEPLVPRDPAWAVSLAKQSRLPNITENIARRLSLDLEHRSGEVQQLLVAALSGDVAHPESVIAGMAKALHGVRRAEAPASWSAAAEKFAKSSNEETRKHVQSLNVIFGEGVAIVELKKLAADTVADPQARRQALTALLEGRPEGYAPTLLNLLTDRAVTLEAIRGLAYYDDPQIPNRILNRLRAYGAAERAEAINTLAARPASAKALLQAVRDGKLAAGEISAFHARQLSDFHDPGIDADLKELWGEVRVSAAEKRALIDRYKKELTPEVLAKADASAGRAIFNKSCANCHVLYGEGRKIGPDLTGSNRKNLDYLLENVVDPSASVAADFRSVSVTLADGRVLSGVVGEQNDRTVTLLTAQEPQVLDRNEIEELTPTGQSLMPDGQLQQMAPDQIRDLIKYLMSTEQVPLKP
ncbi:MAG: c-type cytochrome [Planctomycetales bacterium]|nr:c-type cytochrome [Planctomycetales bacterium]MBN8627901.1 c-type cytochrome [Planctomycetota bacterium]